MSGRDPAQGARQCRGRGLERDVRGRPVAFYPAVDAMTDEPIPLRPDIRPLHTPRDVALASDGRLMVQEWLSGRVSIVYE